MQENHAALGAEARERLTVAQNVLAQIENLRTHPGVAAALARGELQLHGWVYTLETGDVLAYDFRRERFVSLCEQEACPLPPPAVVAADCVR
jgi:carbonic anhydrase